MRSRSYTDIEPEKTIASTYQGVSLRLIIKDSRFNIILTAFLGSPR